MTVQIEESGASSVPIFVVRNILVFLVLGFIVVLLAGYCYLLLPILVLLC